MANRTKDITGQQFNYLTADRLFEIKTRPSGVKVYRWAFRCICGKETVADKSNVLRGTIKSCGCMYMKGRKDYRGGISKHPLYNKHNDMMRRCYDEGDVQYAGYGGRGIRVYEPWHDLETFISDIEQRLGECPKGHQIDRYPDNDGDYQPDNVRWATPKENTDNRRVSHGHSEASKRTPTYNCWRTMCRTAREQVCHEWINDNNPNTLNGFKQFFEDMGEKRGMLKRHDPSKPYSKENCFWQLV